MQSHSGGSITQTSSGGSVTQLAGSGSATAVAGRPAPKAWVSTKLTRNTHNRVWPAGLLPARRADAPHPLAFLKNCSSQFRNAVLKKNTVSTMLELKRAFQSKGDEDKLVAFWGRRKVYALNKQAHRRPTLSELKCEPKSSLTRDDVGVEISDTSSRESPHFPGRTVDAVPAYGSLPGSDRPASPEGPPSDVETDDRVALSNAYRAQAESQSGDRTAGDGNSLLSFSHFHVCGQDGGRLSVPGEGGGELSGVSLGGCLQVMKAEDSGRLGVAMEGGGERSGVSLSGCLQVMKAEDGQAIMSMAGFDGDNVNLTTVDPWGVCTDEDLGEIAEMMSDKGESKISHSSSRKRKLSTPRKMVQ